MPKTYNVIDSRMLPWVQKGNTLDYVLLSYYDAKKINMDGSGDKKIIFEYYLKAKNKLLDCGVFSFHGKFIKGKFNPTREWMWEYAKEYGDFIIKYKFKNYECFELDIGVFFDDDYQFTEEIRNWMEDYTGVKLIPVYHPYIDLDTWDRWCATHRRVAAAEFTPRKPTLRKNPELLKKVIEIAKSYNCKIHALGYVRNTDIANGTYQFDSGDTSSFLYVFKYPQNCEFKKINGIDVAYNHQVPSYSTDRTPETRLQEFNKFMDWHVYFMNIFDQEDFSYD